MSALLIICGLSVPVFAVSMTGAKPHLFWGQSHHAYYGWLVALAGFYLHMDALLIMGNILAWDDALQHFVHAYGGSPIHVLYGWAYRLPFVRRVNRWLDARLKP